MTRSANAVPTAEVATDDPDGDCEGGEMESSLIEEVSIDGLCGVY
ncbi:MAG: mycofactocin precursor MftA [Frankiaceae bacterium]